VVSIVLIRQAVNAVGVIVPALVEEVGDGLHDLMIGIHAKLDIGFEIVVVEIAASKVRRAGQNERRTFLAPKNQHLAVALLAASVAPAHGNVGGVQLPGDLAVGHAILLAPEGVLVGIEQYPYLDAALVGGHQGLDDLAVREIEHQQIQRIALIRRVDHRQGGIADGCLGQDTDFGSALIILVERRRRPVWLINGRKACDGALAFQKVAQIELCSFLVYGAI